MPAQNKVSATLSAEAITNINNAIATIRENLPFLIQLTKEERRRLPKAGDGSQNIVQESLIFVNQHPEALPGTFNKDEYLKDGALKAQYRQVVSAIIQLSEDVRDTDLALDSDMFLQTLDVYAFAKANNRNGAYDSYIDSVKARFARAPRPTATQPA